MDIALFVLAFAVLAAAGIISLALMRARPAAEANPLAPRLDMLTAAQGEIAGRFAQTIEAQSQLQALLAQRMDALDRRLGDTLKETATKTAETMGGIQARLTVIDQAQKNITALSGQVVSLQEVLSNKQSRGAFGQANMEEIVRDALPRTLYEFEPKLSNNTKPDCIIKLPGAKTVLVIDSKFPLEGFEALKRAQSEDEKKLAMARVRSDVLKHVSDIAEKYIIPGETQTPAIMFVPSESIYAELHDGFNDVIQKAHRSQVIVVSPNILMLAINTVQTVMKDARMREQADKIQKEVGVLLQDVRRLAERVLGLQRHFNQAEGDIKDITISMEKISKRGTAIEQVELSGEDPEPELKLR
jgi:DNA recombination protein RmuC